MLKVYRERTYDIKRFYVGELYLSYPISFSEIPEEIIEEKDKIIKSGAVDFQKNLLRKYIDFEENRRYEGVLTVFLKEDDQYICLHNNINYSLDEKENFCENLVPFVDLLPKYSLGFSERLTFEEVLYLFNYLFVRKNRNKLINFYDDGIKYNIDNFYVGDINLYCGFTPENQSRRIKYSNLPQKYLLLRNGININVKSRSFGFRDETFWNMGTHNYESYESLFLKLPNEMMYNVNNSQIYEKGTFDKIYIEPTIIGENYFDYMMPFTEYLKENEIKNKEKEISIRKALRLKK